MTWESEEEELDTVEEPSKAKYIALIGVSFTKPKKARFEAGQEIPELYMKAITPLEYDWLLNRRGAVEKRGN